MAKYVNSEKLLCKIINSYELLYQSEIKEFIAMAEAEDSVEVVRCKDCKHGRPIDKTKAPEKYFKDDCIVCECEDAVGEEPMIYRPDHFCSYGERRC